LHALIAQQAAVCKSKFLLSSLGALILAYYPARQANLTYYQLRPPDAGTASLAAPSPGALPCHSAGRVGACVASKKFTKLNHALNLFFKSFSSLSSNHFSRPISRSSEKPDPVIRIHRRPVSLFALVGTLQLGYPILLCQDSRSYP